MQLVGNRRVLLRFGLSFQNGMLHDRLATVDPGRVVPHVDNPQPEFHEVCVTFTDHKSRLCHQNVDICHMHPQPPKAKGQLLLLLCVPQSYSPSGRYGPYVVQKILKSTKRLCVHDELTQKAVSYAWNQCVRVLNDDEEK